ncbi:hypothetical protein [Perlabentimonas gracilis]|uniref:hypothetical protein n=1 Tax=Perlabentimonas gracilis TaxID=2715279 RepID=UPI00140C4445|nr:hypothetical protein [Perlabentimonas gracilis]NHB70377.1 hypothetical protein [Perlabentimonas gracilis]
MNDLANNEFKTDFIIKTLVQETQFEQWLKITFYLNSKINEGYDIIYQEAYYVKVYELFTEGLEYAKSVYEKLKKSTNIEKKKWYLELINGLDRIITTFDETELLYIEYRRHVSSHIFQNQYEHIQKDLKIKRIRKNNELKEIRENLESIILKHGSDKAVDEYLNKKINPQFSKLYKTLTNTNSD